LLKQNAVDKRTQAYKLLQQTANDLAQDAGGWSNLTEREALLIRSTAFIRVVTGTIEDFCLRKNPIDAQGSLQPVLSQYLSFANTLRLNLQSLGLRPQQTEKELSLESYLKSRETGTEAEQ